MPQELCYKKNYLSEVIARIDFISDIRELEENMPMALGKALAKMFPVVEPPADSISARIELKEEGKSTGHTTKVKRWNFFGRDREKLLSIENTHVFVRYTTYNSFESLKREFQDVLKAITNEFPDVEAKRFGLRYVNKIEIARTDPFKGWHDYFHPELLTDATFFSPQSRVTRLLHVAEMKCGDDVNLRFQFGIPNPDYPAVIKQPQFILDFDAYVSFAHSLQDSLGYMETGHEAIQSLFERSIKEPLRRRMGGKKAQAVKRSTK